MYRLNHAIRLTSRGGDEFPLSPGVKMRQTLASQGKRVKRPSLEEEVLEITDRGLLYPVLGLATASSIVLAFQLYSGHYPDPAAIANLYLVGLGIGFVLARVGRLGPYGGTLGMPWRESRIDELLTRESARARRFGRDLTVIGVKEVGARGMDLYGSVRATDQVIECRSGWKLVVLPETDDKGAQLLLRRLCGDCNVLTAVASFDSTRPRQQLGAELLDSIRSAKPAHQPSPRPSAAQDSRALAS